MANKRIKKKRAKKQQLEVKIDVDLSNVRDFRKALIRAVADQVAQTIENNPQVARKFIEIKDKRETSEANLTVYAAPGVSFDTDKFAISANQETTMEELNQMLEDVAADDRFVYISIDDEIRCTHCEALDYSVTKKEYTLDELKEIIVNGGKTWNTKTKKGSQRKRGIKQWKGKVRSRTWFDPYEFSDFNADQHPHCRCVFVPLSIYQNHKRFIVKWSDIF